MSTLVTLDDYSRLVSAIHAAAITPDHWGGAMAAVRDALGGVAGAIIMVDETSRIIKSADLEPDARQEYVEYYRDVDYVLDAVESGPVGAVRAGTSLIAINPRSEFNHDWMQPHHMDDGMFVRLTDGPRPTCFLVASKNGDEPFATADRLTIVNALIPHLQQALRTQEHVDNLEHAAGDLAGAVDRLRHAVIVVGTGGSVVYLNAEAEAMQARLDGPYVRHGRLRFRTPAADDDLQRCIAQALGSSDSTGRCGNSIVLQRNSPSAPLLVHVLPFASRTGDGDHARALIIVVDPDRQPRPDADLLRRAYGLTKAESEVALLVARGDGLAPIADALTLSMATVKTHLQHVFDKTDTHRQAELVRLLLAVTP